MKKFATIVGTGLAVASLALSAPAFAAGPAPSPAHSEVGATNPVSVPASAVAKENQPIAGNARTSQNTQSSWWSQELGALGVVGGATVAVLAPGAGAGLINGGALAPNLANAAIGG